MRSYQHAKHLAQCLTLIGLSLWLAACATTPRIKQTAVDGPPQYYVDASKVKDPTPQDLPLNKFANKSTYSVNGHTYHVAPSYKNYSRTGTASWYGTKFDGHLTSTGETYSMLKMTAASTTLPIPCYAEVTNLQNGKTVVVKVNDRGPFEKNRLIDLSYVAALKLGIVGHGTAHVKVIGIDPEHFKSLPTSKNLYAKENHKQGNPIYVQAAAVHDKTHAEHLAMQLKQDLKTETSVFASKKNGESLYRVKVGPVYSKDDAEILAAKMQSDGIIHPIVG